ncbi:MAG: bifunctional pyr operon transcriptional regulator/uracil phosphoribosyltransferase PyrR [Bacteroidota bacterium]|nr:bifunctional pyr operon transcriptional regulator/uracil phosphoribosyltransferase PyrR [Bacteroidota bacterium]
MLKEREILNKELIAITIERLCYQLIEQHNTFKNTVLIGLQPRGTYLNNRILQKLKIIMPDSNIESGNVDISFYRDDLMRREHPIVPEEMDINISLEGKDVVLVDDVLFTGRSVRSALDALMTFGRPKSIQLLTLINRRFSRNLPIEPNYVGKTIDVMKSEKIIVEWEDTTGFDRVLMRRIQ